METRFPLQTPTPGLEAFSFWTIATFIMPKRYESLSKMKHVRITYIYYRYNILTRVSTRVQTYISSSILARLEPHRTGLFKHQELFEALLAGSNILNYGSRVSKHQLRESMGLFSCLWLCGVAFRVPPPPFPPFQPLDGVVVMFASSHNTTAWAAVAAAAAGCMALL
jgi:hypothetical protein